MGGGSVCGVERGIVVEVKLEMPEAQMTNGAFALMKM